MMTDTLHNLSIATRSAIERYPFLTKQIRAGLVLAACGLITKYETGYIVKSHFVSWPGNPPRWYCDCVQGQQYGPFCGDFFGYPGKICKHIAAAALASELRQPIPRSKTVWEMVERLVDLPPDLIFNANRVELAPSKMVLIRSDDGHYHLSLNRYHSTPIAIINNGNVELLPTARKSYEDLLQIAF